MNTDNSIYKEVVNQIGNILENFEDKKIKWLELDKNDKVQLNCSQDLNECLDLVENMDFETNVENLNYNSNIDIIRIKAIIEKLLKKNTNNLDNNLEIKLGNIDNRLNKLSEKMGNQDVIDYNQSNLLNIKDDILNEFKEIKEKLNQVLDISNENDDSCNSNIHELKLLIDNINQKKEPLNNENLLNEINNLNEKLNQILGNNNFKNDTLSEKISLLNDKLTLNNNSDLYAEISNLNHKLNLLNNNNEDNVSLLSKKLKEIINLIDDQSSFNIENYKDNIKNVIKPNSNIAKLSDNDRKRLDELKDNIKNLNKKSIDQNNQDNEIMLSFNGNNNLEQNDLEKNDMKTNDNLEPSDNFSENDIESLDSLNNSKIKINNKPKIKFSKNKNPFEYIYENTDGIKFKNLNMEGGGKIEQLRELRKKSVKPLKKFKNKKE